VKEIGSEFWLEQKVPEPAVPEAHRRVEGPLLSSEDEDKCYVLSGRTAIDLIIQNILKTRKIQNVYLPAWCCDSMIAPFKAHGICVDFYDIRFDGMLKCHTDGTDHTDIFYVTNYFGYENTLPIVSVKRYKEQGCIIVYDKTHSLFMDNDPYITLADYSFISIRKWMGVVAGAVVSGVGECELKSCPYLKGKEKAMQMKKAFIEGDETIDKQAFLNLYAEFGHHLAEDYQNYEMDELSYAVYKSADLATMRCKRRENAQYLHKHLKGVKFIGELMDNAVPLFVPVVFETTEQRNAVRKKLIDAQIYCPIHWPKPALIPADFEANKIYDTELSLICDQRYDLADMERMVTLINVFLGHTDGTDYTDYVRRSEQLSHNKERERSV
jgi:hypothetical protein